MKFPEAKAKDLAKTAAYREAYDHAIEMNRKINFDYTQENRPLIMQGDGNAAATTNPRSRCW